MLDAPDRPDPYSEEAEPEPPPPVPIPARPELRAAGARPEPLRIRLPTIVPNEVPATDEETRGEATTGETLRADAVFAGRYRIQESLTHSGGLDCYLAIKEPMVRRVVLGVLTTIPAGMDRSTVEARFLQECADLARIQRPELARVYDFGRDPHGRCFVVLELVYGLSLREVMNWGPLAESRVATILESLARGMAEIHKVGMPLRELRSDQILLEPDRDGRERARIVNFGLGVVHLPPGGDTDVAPELREGGEPTRSGDVYALGVLMHRALTGRAVGLSEDGDPLANVSPRMAAVLRRCLAVTDVRYPTALALLADLEAPGPALVAPPPAVVLPTTRVNPLLVGIASAAIGALLATWAFLLATDRLDKAAPPPVAPVAAGDAGLVVPAQVPAPPVVETPAPVVETPPPVVEAPVQVAPPPPTRNQSPTRAAPKSSEPKAPAPAPVPETPWMQPPEAAPAVTPPAPAVSTAPVQEQPKVEATPEPPPKYPAAKALSGLWTGAVDGQSLAMDLKIDGNGKVTGTSRIAVDGTPQSGKVSGVVTPADGGAWNVELQLQTDAGILTLSGKVTGSSMRGRALQAGSNVGKWSASR